MSKDATRYQVELREGAYWVIDTQTDEPADGPYPPPVKAREANLLDEAWAEGKAGRLNAEWAGGDRPGEAA
jgi:hypothetical protein